MAIFSNSIIPAAAAAADDVVTKSLRFDRASSPKLTRTFGTPTSQKKVTISWWMKLAEQGSGTGYCGVISAGSGYENYTIIKLDGGTTNVITFEEVAGGAYKSNRSTIRAFRDMGAWMHCVHVIDTTDSTPNDRSKLYINGVRYEGPFADGDGGAGLGHATYTEDYDTNWSKSGQEIGIGLDNATAGPYFGGYLADIHYIDGTALTPTSFAEEDTTTGQWKPKAYNTADGAYGNNGFHLDFADSTVSSTSFIDSSSNGLTVTANGDVAHSETQKKIGDSSIYGDGTGDYLSLNGESGLAFGTGDYTIEMWFRPASTASAIALYDGRATGNYYDATPYIYMASGGGIDAGYSDGSANHSITATGVFTADTWHHVALVRSSGTTRAYIDGDEVGTAQTDAATLTNPSSRPYIGQGGAAQNYDFDGYMDEIRVSSVARYSGTGSGAFTPSTTAFTSDSDTKLLIHSSFSGGIGNDAAGSNNFTATNLAASDVMEDTPTSNFCTWNPISGPPRPAMTFSEGNLKTVGNYSIHFPRVMGTMLVSSGKWFHEIRCGSTQTTSREYGFKGHQTSWPVSGGNHGLGGGSAEWDTNAEFAFSAYHKGIKFSNSSTPEVRDDSWGWGTDGDIIGLALDLDSSPRTFRVFKDGSEVGTATDIPAGGSDDWVPALDPTSVSAQTSVANFGQDATFAGTESGTTYTTDAGGGDTGGEFTMQPPAGYKAWTTKNLTASIAKPAEYFDTDLWTGDSASTRDIATPFDPAFVWIKCRNNGGNGADHTLWDSLRGVSSSVNTGLSSSHPEPEGFQNDVTTPMQYGGVSVLGTELYTLKEGAANARYVNETGRTYVGWSWKAGSTATNEVYNADSGFSIVKWTGDDNSMSGDAQRVSHSLGVAPELILAKNRWNTGDPDNFNWQVYHKDVGASKYLILNNSNAEASYETNNSIVPYSTTDVDFRDDMGMSDTIYMNQGDNMSNDPPTPETYAAYLFASVEGYSKVGSYTGNGLADGTFVYCGFRPAYILIKALAGYSWYQFDSKRATYNVVYDFLQANTADAEQSYTTLDITSNGFKFRTTGVGVNGSASYIFYAVGQSSKYASAR